MNTKQNSYLVRDILYLLGWNQCFFSQLF